MEQRLSYKGMGIVIDYEDDDHAEVRIADRTFGMTRHGGPLAMWTCDEAYFMSDDLLDLVRHLVDYWYIITSPNTAPFEGPHHGDLAAPPGGVVSAHPVAGGDDGDDDDDEPDHQGHDEKRRPERRGRSRRN